MEENFGTKTPNYCCPEAQETLVLYYFFTFFQNNLERKALFYTKPSFCFGLCKVGPNLTHHSKIKKMAGQNTFPIVLLNGDKMIKEKQERRHHFEFSNGVKTLDLDKQAIEIFEGLILVPQSQGIKMVSSKFPILIYWVKKTYFVSRKLFQNKASQIGDKLISTKYRNINN